MVNYFVALFRFAVLFIILLSLLRRTDAQESPDNSVDNEMARNAKFVTLSPKKSFVTSADHAYTGPVQYGTIAIPTPGPVVRPEAFPLIRRRDMVHKPMFPQGSYHHQPGVFVHGVYPQPQPWPMPQMGYQQPWGMPNVPYQQPWGYQQPPWGHPYQQSYHQYNSVKTNEVAQPPGRRRSGTTDHPSNDTAEPGAETQADTQVELVADPGQGFAYYPYALPNGFAYGYPFGVQQPYPVIDPNAMYTINQPQETNLPLANVQQLPPQVQQSETVPQQQFGSSNFATGTQTRSADTKLTNLADPSGTMSLRLNSNKMPQPLVPDKNVHLPGGYVEGARYDENDTQSLTNPVEGQQPAPILPQGLIQNPPVNPQQVQGQQLAVSPPQEPHLPNNLQQVQLPQIVISPSQGQGPQLPAISLLGQIQQPPINPQLGQSQQLAGEPKPAEVQQPVFETVPLGSTNGQQAEAAVPPSAAQLARYYQASGRTAHLRPPPPQYGGIPIPYHNQRLPSYGPNPMPHGSPVRGRYKRHVYNSLYNIHD